MKILAFTYMLLFYGLLGGVRSYILYRQTGINPFKLKSDDSIQGFNLMIFKIVVVAIAIITTLYAFGGEYYGYVQPISYIDQQDIFKIIGAALSVSALVWCYIAQLQMGRSWRIGIDESERTTLATNGLFQYSRNPIFLGMLVSGVGVFLFLPSVVTCMTLTMSWISVAIQIRLEEAYLSDIHGEDYVAYRSKVRRWI